MDLVSESLSTLPSSELVVIAAQCDQQADKLSETEPAWSVVWRAMGLAAEQALLARHNETS